MGERQYPVDIFSYAYQRDYYYSEYGLSEFEFLAYAFLTLGGGFDYDKEQGRLFSDGVKYLKELEREENPREQNFTSINYCMPKNISYLNEEWLDGLKFMVEVLKRDKPTPIAYEGDSPEDALNKAVAYYELKIAKLQNKPKP